MATVSITVAAPPPLVLMPAALQDGRVNTPYLQDITVSSGVAPYSLTASGLPAGLNLAAGAIAGTPSQAGVFNVTLSAVDSLGAVGTAIMPLTIAAELPVTAAFSAKVAANSRDNALVPVLSGGIADRLDLASAPAHGQVTVNGLGFSYTPTAGYSGPDSFSYTAHNGGGSSAAAMVNITVLADDLAILPRSLANVLEASTYRAQLSASGGDAPYSFTATGLPAGLSLSSDGVIAGVTSAVGSHPMTILVTDANGATGRLDLTLQVVSNPGGSLQPAAQNVVISTTGTAEIDLAAGVTGTVYGARILGLEPAGSGRVELFAPAAPAMMRMARVAPPATPAVMMSFTPTPGFTGQAKVTFELFGPEGSSQPTVVTISVLSTLDPLASGDVMALAAAQGDAAVRMARSQMDGLHGHMRDRRADACLSNSLDLALTGPQDSAGGGGARAAISQEACSDLAQGSVAIWGEGSIDFGKWQDRSFAEAIDHTSQALTLGLDYRIDSRSMAGLALTYGRDTSDIGRNGTQSRNKAYGVALYSSFDLGESYYVDGVIGMAQLQFSSQRWIADMAAMVQGERDGRQVYASVSAGRSFDLGPQSLDTYLRLSGSQSKLDAFAETGPAALRYEEQVVRSLVGAIGVSSSRTYAVAGGMFRPSVSGELSHDFSGSSDLGVSYDGISGATLYEAEIARQERTALALRLGFDFQHAEGWDMGAELGARLDAEGVSSQELRLNWKIAF